ncbi:MAG: class II aldolase/adducin family protein [Dehalococcoidia bacterium]|nr:class II aldolase/adducin family protein [Dehalococcoidia bacterium]
MSVWESEKQSVLDAARKMVQQGFVVGTSGNVSVRLRDTDGRDLIAITPTGCHYDLLNTSDMVVADFDGVRLEGEISPSIEMMLHLGIYRARNRVNAVIHTHPAFGGVLSVMGIEIPSILDDQVTYLGGDIKIAPYALPGSKELVQNVVSALGPRNAVILANHGALAVGRDLREAYTNCEMLEKTARTYIYALALKKVNLLPPEALELEQAYFNYQFGEDH